MSDAFNPNDMILRFRERAEAVRKRGLPPVEGPERQMFMDAAKLDFQDYAMLGDAVATVAIFFVVNSFVFFFDFEMRLFNIIK